VLATSAVDAQLGLSVLTGRASAEVARPARRRVAVAFRPGLGVLAAASARTSVRDAARLLIAAGHDAVLRSGGHKPVGSFANVAGLRPLPPGAVSDWRDRCVAWFAGAGLHALLLPAGGSPPRVDRPGRRVGGRLRRDWVAFSGAGLPAAVVPFGRRPDGLPGAVQIVGPPGSEPVLLGLMAELESAAPWRPHAPTWPRTKVRSW
jgi:amidase